MSAAEPVEKSADDIFEKIALDVFETIDLFDTIEPAKIKEYVAPPKVSVSLSDEIRQLIQDEIKSAIKEAVSEAVKKIKPRIIETKITERVIEKTTPTPQKIVIKEKLDDVDLQKSIDKKIKNALDEAPLFIPAPPILPSMSSQSGKILSNDGNQPKWITAAASSGGTSPDAYAVSNVTTDRNYNAIDTTLDEIANVLGSLIVSLQGAGIVQ